MEWDDFKQFVDPNSLQGDATVQPQDHPLDLQLGLLRG